MACQTLSLTSSCSPLLFPDSGISPNAQFTNHVKWSNLQTNWINQIKGIRRLNLIILEKKNINGKQKLHCASVHTTQIRFALSALSFCMWWQCRNFALFLSALKVYFAHAYTVSKTTDWFIHYSLLREHHIECKMCSYAYAYFLWCYIMVALSYRM